MGIDCGSQATLCEYPIHIDTYSGCSHGCKYCFAQTKVDLKKIVMKNCAQQLRNFITGKRTKNTNWCDWPIPLHWGGISDPFQPCERKLGVSLEILKIFEETQYPVIISTKGKLITEEPYISILSRCNAVVQVSMVCFSYDKMEPGAPSFEQRLEMVKKLSGNCKRVIVRAQPYITDVKDEFIANIPKFAEAGAYGITIEGMKFKKKKSGLLKVGGDYCYSENLLKTHYIKIREVCHKNNLAFFCAENRLRTMGDSSACCGAGGVNGFEGNRFNVVSLTNGIECKPTDKMCECGTAGCFKAIYQTTEGTRKLKSMSFAAQMLVEAKKHR